MTSPNPIDHDKAKQDAEWFAGSMADTAERNLALAYLAVVAPPSTKAYDSVQRPAHYTSGDIECADAVTAALHGEQDATVAWCRGNAIKYLWRSGKKDDAVQDLRKAIWYIERAIQRLETGF
jgi:hypothetical protein